MTHLDVPGRMLAHFIWQRTEGRAALGLAGHGGLGRRAEEVVWGMVMTLSVYTC